MREDRGGKGINAAKVLKGFSIESVAIGFLGKNLEEIIRSEQKEKGIAEKFIAIEGSTRTNTKTIDKKKSLMTKNHDPGPLGREEDRLKFYQVFGCLTSIFT